MTERPIASLILLSYNQEAYIADAVSAALAQDFEALEIIISDDCSTDQTAEIARALVRESKHKNAAVRQPAANLGLVDNLFDAVTVARGDIIVIAAGDDVSYSNRVSTLVERWQKTGADALFSDWDVIDSDGKLVRRGRVKSMVQDGIRLADYFPGQSITHVMGTTSAYSASLLRSIPKLNCKFVAEDFLVTLFVGLRRGRIVELSDRLVGYRVHDHATTHVEQSKLSVAALEARTRDSARWQCEILRAFRDHVRQYHGSGGIDFKAVDEDIAFLEARARWQEMSVLERSAMLFKSPVWGWKRWMAPRLFGERPLGLIKALRSLVRPGIPIQ